MSMFLFKSKSLNSFEASFENLINGVKNGNGDVHDFFNFCNISLDENNLPDFSVFFENILKRIQTVLLTHPQENTTILNSTSSLQQIQHPSSFRDGRIVYLKNGEKENIYVLGDLHGDWGAFHRFMLKTNIYMQLQQKLAKLVFLGDYIDRGLKGLEILLAVFLLKILFPDNVLLLLGNHEVWTEKDGVVYPTVSGDNLFLEFWKEHFTDTLLLELKKIFDLLPVVIFTNDEMLFVHAGIPRPRGEEMNYGFLNHLAKLNDPELILEMVWARPENKKNVIITYGASEFSFAEKHFNEFMERVGAKVMIRGHDAEIDGFRLLYNGRLITIFSTGGKNEDNFVGYANIRPVYGQISSGILTIHPIYELAKINLKEVNYANYPSTTPSI